MGFGIKIKVEAPKVEVPKVDVAKAVSGATAAAMGAVSGAIDSAKDAVNGAVDSVTGAVNDAVGAATGAIAALSSVAGAIADVAVSFTGSIVDFVLEPHLQLSANASWGDTHFEKGPIRIRVELTPEEASGNGDALHLFSNSGAFDERREIGKFSGDNGTTVVMQFEDAPMNETYSLEVIPEEGGPPRTIFTNIAYGDLRRTKQRFVSS